MYDNERETINALRERGFAVTIFTPEELRGADPGNVEADMVARGWDSIDWHASEPPEDSGPLEEL